MVLEDVVHLAKQFWVVWLMIIFVGLIYWAYRPKNKTRFEDHGNIPFRDESNGG